MHLLETYSNHVGVSLTNAPVPPAEKFFPIEGKYITFQASSGFGSKNYPYYAEVIKYTKESLNKEGINIVQVGLQGDIDIGSNINLAGKTSFSQACYVIKNSICHIGNDSVWVHVANSYGKNIVCLFGSTLPKVSGPFFNNAKIKILESHRNGLKASLSLEDPSNAIALINPEDIANSIFEVLDIDNKIQIKTHKVGALFNSPFLEVDLSKETLININPDIQLNLRLDWHMDLDLAFRLAQKHNISIITDKKIDFGFLNSAKNKISQILFEINSQDVDMDYIKSLYSYGKAHVISDLKDKELSDLKLKLFDYFAVAPKIENLEPIKEEGLFFRNNGGIISGDKKYPTKWHLDNKIYSESGEYEVPNTEDKTFWLYKEFLHFYEKTV
jgi:hypothetical protein